MRTKQLKDEIVNPPQKRTGTAWSDVSNADWQKLHRILGGHIYFQTLAAGVQLRLFDLLNEHGPLTRSEIAQRLGIQDRPARILLLGCTTLELLEKSGERYANTRIADHLLVRRSPGNIVAVVEWQHLINYQAMYHFYDAIVANKNVGLGVFEGDEPTLYERLTHNPRLERVFQDAMAAISIQANAMFAESTDLADVKHLVDVGGGNGSNVITLAKKYPTLRATVFDSPTVCQIARDNFKAERLADRLDAVEGDCFQTPFPKGCDCVLFCHFLTIWSEAENRALLEKAYAALPSGGRVVVFNMMQWDDETGPLTAAMGSPYFLTLATGKGMLYTARDYEQWMREAGFSDVDRQSLPLDHGVITCRKP